MGALADREMPATATKPLRGNKPEIYDVRQAADLLGVPLGSIRAAISRKQIRGIQLGLKWFVRKDDIDRLRNIIA